MEERKEEGQLWDDEELNSMFPGWKPKPVEVESSINFDEPCYGSYDVEFNVFETKKYDVVPAVYAIKDDGTAERIQLNFKVFNDVKGDVSGNRYLRKTFWMGAGKSEYGGDPNDEFHGVKKLISALTSCGAQFNISNSKDYKQFVIDLCEDLKGFKARVSQYKYNEKPAMRFYKYSGKEEAVGNPLLVQYKTTG